MMPGKHATHGKHAVSALFGMLFLLLATLASADHVVLLPENLSEELLDAVENAGFDRPQGMTFSTEGLLFVADTFHHCVRSIDTNVGEIRTILGTCGKSGQHPEEGGEALADTVLLHHPAAIHWDGDEERLFLLDSGNHRLLIFRPNRPELPVRSIRLEWVENFSHVPDLLHHPLGITADEGGRIFIADSAHHRVLVLDADGKQTQIMAGTGEPGYAWKERAALKSPLNTPTDVIAWHGEDGFSGLFVIDSRNGLLRLITPGEKEPWLMSNYAGSDDPAVWREEEGAAQLFRLKRPYRVTYSAGRAKTFFISVPTEKRIVGVSSEREAFVAAGPGAWQGYSSEDPEVMARVESVRKLGTPHAMAANNDGYLWVFVDTDTLRVFLPDTLPPEEEEK